MVNNVYLCLSFKQFYTIMKQFIISAAVALCSLSLCAQTKQLTLEEAMSGGNFRINYPDINIDALGQNEAMPYEDQKDATDETQSDKEQFLLRFTNRQRVWRYATRGDFYLYDRNSLQ